AIPRLVASTKAQRTKPLRSQQPRSCNLRSTTLSPAERCAKPTRAVSDDVALWRNAFRNLELRRAKLKAVLSTRARPNGLGLGASNSPQMGHMNPRKYSQLQRSYVNMAQQFFCKQQTRCIPPRIRRTRTYAKQFGQNCG